MLITGGSSGIGEGLAKQFTLLGANVIITGRNEEELKRVSKENKCDYVTMDLTDPYSVESQVKSKLSSYPNIDILIHNAGLSQREEFLNTTPDLNEKLLNVDFLSVVALT